MKNLSELSDEQKSVMLARLCGWGVGRAMAGTKYESVFIYTQNNQWFTNLYDPANMSAAWQVLNWASSDKSPHPEERDEMQYKMQEWLTYHVGWLDILPPADAQRAWLDAILSLADGAGMLEEQNAND